MRDIVLRFGNEGFAQWHFLQADLASDLFHRDWFGFVFGFHRSLQAIPLSNSALAPAGIAIRTGDRQHRSCLMVQFAALTEPGN